MACFDNQIAVVTGASSGLGRATAQRLAAEGATVALVDLNAEAGEESAEEIRSGGGTARFYSIDVTNWTSVESAIAAVVADFGAPSVLVNCAAIGKFVRSELESQDNWEQIIGVNLTGTFLMCRSVLPGMLAAGRGSIVNVASNSGLLGQPYSAAYCASKGGVVNLTRALAVEYRGRGVRVNAICPGGINTPMLSSWRLPEGAKPKEFARGISPIGYAEPSEIAGLIAFVASDDGRYMIGQIVGIDGGITCG
jgi:NAD(P)-dependent dehydrogenase (short-subunit alcohol dehydrogenase family)